MIRAALTYGLFPSVFLSAQLGAWRWREAGGSEGMILAVLTVAVGLLLLVIERWHPEHPSWNTPDADIGVDVTHTAVSMVLVPKLLELLVPPMVLATTVWAIGEGGVWPSNWPLVLQLALALIISQFGEYWAHRLMHTVPLLWRLHAVHHSPRRLYFLNAARFHPLDTAASFTLALAPLVALGAGPDLMLQFSVWVAVHGMFQHCNIRVRLGPLNWVFSMAELHRWHHSLKLEEANANYGNNILFWDVVFGTVHWPADREASAQIGLGGMPNFPTSYLGQMLAPWRWEAASAPQEGHRAPDA